MSELLNPLDFPQPLRLDIGAGVKDESYPFTTVDLYTDSNIRAAMWDIPLPDESVDVIISIQSLEHVSKFQVIPTLREWWRILKVGGQLEIQVPDLEWACNLWLEYKDTAQVTGWPLDIIYGNQLHEGEFHKTGFTREVLWSYLTIANTGDWFVHRLDFLEGTGIREPEVVQRVIVLHANKVRKEEVG